MLILLFLLILHLIPLFLLFGIKLKYKETRSPSPHLSNHGYCLCANEQRDSILMTF